MKYIILLLSLCIIGCAGVNPFGLPTQVGQKEVAGVGFAGGIAAEKAKNKIVEVLTPDYPLYYKPAEICTNTYDAEGSQVVLCNIVPCAAENTCQKSYTTAEFEEYSPYFISSSSFTAREGALIEFYKHNKEAVIKQLGAYEGEKFVVID